MKHGLYIIFDLIAEMVSGQPFVAPNNGAAIRLFSDRANEPGNAISKHPEHFVLRRIGAYDPINGFVDPIINEAEQVTYESLGAATNFLIHE